MFDVLYVHSCIYPRKICLQLFLRLRRGGSLHLHNPLQSRQNFHSWDFSHSWYFSCYCLYTVTFLIGYQCILWYWSTHVHLCAGLLGGVNIKISIVLYLNSASFFWITIILVTVGDLAVSCALCNYLLLLFCDDGTDLPLFFLQNSDTCILRQWCGSSCASCTSRTVLCSHLFCPSSQWKFLPTLLGSLGDLYSLVSWYRFLVVPESYFLTFVADQCYFTRNLYICVTLCHFFSSLWLHTFFFVVFAFLVFSVPVHFLDLSGSFCYVFEISLLVYVEIKLISKFCTPCVSLFKKFGICVSPHIPYNFQISPGSLTSVVSWYLYGSW